MNKKNINKWIFDNKLSVTIQYDRILYVEEYDGAFLFLEDERECIFDDNFHIILDKNDKSFLLNTDLNIKYVLYEFGGKYYYDLLKDIDNPKLNLFKYIGKANQELIALQTYLGVHGSYEILNGSTKYDDWCEKAKFLKYDTLAICERNTLAGTISFQFICEEYNIKSILGEEIVINNNDNKIEIKLYVIDEIGWENLLFINKIINIDNKQFRYISQDDLFKYSKGLICIFDSKTILNKELINEYKKYFKFLYYQIDTVIWESDSRDRDYLLNQKNYIDNFINEIPAILINDTYYLDYEDNHIKYILNKIAGLSHQAISNNQYMKNADDNFNILSKLFDNEDEMLNLFIKICDNANELSNICNFKINTNTLFLPNFKLADDSLYKPSFINNETLFLNLIKEGFNKKIKNKVDNEQLYIDRIEKEFNVIKKQGFIDYFLILWDIVLFCKINDILVGIGRGSAAGALISYLLNIIEIDPIKYDLLFERFMNEGRKKLPDIDMDFEGNKRDIIKKYIEEKYGINHVCSIGTYGRLQSKAAMVDLGKQRGISHSTINFYSKMIDSSNKDWCNIFKDLKNKPALKKFIKDNVDLFNDINLVLKQPRNQSIHACAMLILPDNKNIYNSIPVRIIDNILVSEWEGEHLAKAGYLKEDILGVKQLDKFKNIINIIKKNYNIDIDIYNLNLEDINIYELFKKGYTADVFQFGTPGLTKYSKDVKPENIKELIAMVSLYRPGAMQSNAHIDYINLKFGRKNPEYDYMLEDITKSTYGLYIYQEQVMQACRILGNMSLHEADDIRAAMGKKKISILEPYKQQFITGAVNNNCDFFEAEKIWYKLEAFAGYGFNLSHATAYAITGYICQYLKYHYSLEFWTTAFQFDDSNDSKANRFISEISKINKDIIINSVDVNNSYEHFYTDFDKKIIYWSLIKIKQLGESAAKAIIDERNKNGNFFSLDEFIKRINKSKVNKRVIENLIFAGAFDIIENVIDIRDRINLFFKYYDTQNVKEVDYNELLLSDNIDKEYWWKLRQIEVSNFAIFNFSNVIKESNLDKKIKNPVSLYCTNEEYFDWDSDVQTTYSNNGYNTYKQSNNKRVIVGGIIKDVIERNSKKGKFANIVLDSNGDELHVNFWSKYWQEQRKYFDNSIGKILLVYGRLDYDSFKKTNVIQIEDDYVYDILS